MAEHRRPAIPFPDAPRGQCRWCGNPILHGRGARRGQPNRRRRWHAGCVEAYNATDPRELRRRVRRRDRGRCALCRLDTYALRRRTRGARQWAELRARGFRRRRSLWELDHVVPLIDGGSHELSNLQTLCVPCHREKSASESRERARRRAPPRARDPRPGARSEPPEPLERELDRLLERVDTANARALAALEGRGAQPGRVR